MLSPYVQVGQCPTSSIHFLHLPREIRQMIYHDILSQQSIVLRDRLSPAASCGRRYWRFHLDRAQEMENTFSLLSLCKQIHDEVRPLLQHYTPSHLILSRELHTLPRAGNDILDLPTAQVTHLTINVKNLGKNSKASRVCLGSSSAGFMLSCCGLNMCGFEEDVPPPESNRLPNLDNIYQLSDFISKSFPALREFHIYDVLKHSLSHPEPCHCPIAGTESCACGTCQCDCISHPPLPTSRDLSIDQLESQLCEALISRYRAALPKWSSIDSLDHWRRAFSDYFVLLDLLAHGVHVFLHDEITITAPLDVDSDQLLYKDRWHATYYIAPPENAKTPADPQIGVLAKPNQQFQNKKEVTVEDLLDSYECFTERKLRDLPEGVTEKPDVFYSLSLQNLDGQSFDKIVEKNSQEADTQTNVREDTDEKCQKHWKWG